MNTPTNLKYTTKHEWVRTEANGTAYVGITDYAQSQLGDIVFIDVDAKGETIAQGNAFGAVEAVKAVSDLYMPVSGEVIDFNEALTNAPDLVNSNPYGEGWIIKVKMSNPAELNALLSAEEYAKLV